MKKSQVVYFIIFGIILLLVFVFIILYGNLMKKEISEEELLKERRIEDALIPIDVSLRTCYYNLFKEIIMQLGQQGGFYEFTGLPYDRFTGEKANYISFENEFKIPIVYKFDFSEGLKMRLFSTEEFLKNVKTIGEKRAIECINQVSKIYPNFEIQAKGTPKVDYLLRDRELFVIIHYNLDVFFEQDNKRKKSSLEKFVIPLDVRLKELINVSNHIILWMVKDRTIEDLMVEYFIPFRSLSIDSFPPSFEISEKFLVWNKDELQTKFKNIAFAFSSKLRVVNNLANPVLKERKWDILIPYHYNPIPYHINIFSLYLDPIFKIGPNVKFPIHLPTINKEAKKISIPIFKFFTPLRFTYVSQYYYGIPLVFQIEDKGAFKGEGFKFNFAVIPTVCVDKPCYDKESLTDDIVQQYKDIACYGPMNVSFSLRFNGQDLQLLDNIYVTLVCGGISCDYFIPMNAQNEYSFNAPYCEDGELSIFVKDFATYYNSSVNLIPKTLEKYEIDLGTINLYYPVSFSIKDIEVFEYSENSNEENFKIPQDEYFVSMINSQDPTYMLYISSKESAINSFKVIPGEYDYTVVYIRNEPLYVLGSAHEGKNIREISNDLYKQLLQNLKNDENKLKDFITSRFDKLAVPLLYWFNDTLQLNGSANKIKVNCGICLGTLGCALGNIDAKDAIQEIKSDQKKYNFIKELIYDIFKTALEWDDFDILSGYLEISNYPYNYLRFGCEAGKDPLKGIILDKFPYSIVNTNIQINFEDLQGATKITIPLLKKKPLLTVLDEINFEVSEDEIANIKPIFVK
ncbi:MAG: hypothetical protein QXD62_02475 [Candidatus Woesearchaeota archaeon]